MKNLLYVASRSAFFLYLAIQVSPIFADKPNIVFIYVDDLGWKDPSFMGSDFFETPNLDKLANQGMVFTNAYSCAANCAPARASLLSGQYSPRHHIYNVGTKPRGDTKHRRLLHIPGTDTLDPKTQTWSQQLQAAGYKTATIGKWHLSDDPRSFGFDVNIGGTHAGGPPRGYYPPHGNVPGLKNAPDSEYVTDRLANEAIKFIRQNKENTWAVYLTHFAVHTPLNPKKELLEKYRNKPRGKLHSNVPMATMIQAVDDGVGAIMKTLDELGIRENTVIVFSSDNGGYGPATDMHPLKGYKGTYYEGGIRVPLFVTWPTQIAAGSICDEPVIAVDIYPTFCAMADIAPGNNQTLDGINLLPLLTGKTDKLPTRSLHWFFPAYLQSYGVFDEQRDPLFRSRPCSIIRNGDWKLHFYFEDNAVELYNLNQDIGETTNLAQSNPEMKEKLLTALQQWHRDTQAQIPDQPNPEFDAQAEKWAIRQRLRQQ
jgi:arylsulfatase A-like enzyme